MASDEDFQSSSLTKRKVRRSYLVTYSQADLEKFPTRESFGKVVVTAFDKGSGKVKVEHWACALEHHANGGKHYHVSLKLSGPKRWIFAKNELCEKHGVVVNFSETHGNYHTAYRYICKSDNGVLQTILT